MLKLNKIFDWEPEPIIQDFPEDFPGDLKEKILKNNETGNTDMVSYRIYAVDFSPHDNNFMTQFTLRMIANKNF